MLDMRSKSGTPAALASGLAPDLAVRRGRPESRKDGRLVCNIRKKRKSAVHAQGARCYYCDQPIWEGDAERFRRNHGISKKRARLFQATAEHMRARRDGGGNGAGNIVAACRFCNQTRHRARQPLDPGRYKMHVAGRLSAGRWLRLS